MMKRILIVLALMPLMAQAQEDTKLPEKGDNLIVITTDWIQEVNYERFSRHLLLNGFTFENADKELGYLATDPKDCKYGSHYDYALNVVFSGNLIIVRVKQSGLSLGLAMVHSYQVIWTDWEYAKSKGNIQRNTFDDFYPILSSYGFPLEFSRD